MAQSFSARVYGTLNEQPPYVATNGQLPSVQATFASTASLVTSFPAAPVNVWPVAGGVKMNGGVICYGVIEVPATGLQLYSTKYVVQETVAAIATLRNV